MIVSFWKREDRKEIHLASFVTTFMPQIGHVIYFTTRSGESMSVRVTEAHCKLSEGDRNGPADERHDFYCEKYEHER